MSELQNDTWRGNWYDAEGVAINKDANKYHNITAEQQAALLKAGQMIGTSIQNKQSQDSATGCKKPTLPEYFGNKGNWEAYRACLSKSNAPQTVFVNAPSPSPSFLSTTAGKATIVGVALLAIVGTVLIVKSRKK